MTRGERGPSAVAATASLPRMFSAATRAWYLPMWVSSARPLTSPIAYSQSRPPTRSPVVDLDRARRGSSADRLEAEVRRCAARGRPRPAARRRSTRLAALELRRDLAAASPRDAPSALAPVRTSTPCSRSASVTCSPANGSSRGSSAVAALDQRRPAAPSVWPGLGQLGADHAAAEDHERVRAPASRSSPRGWSRLAPRRARRSAASPRRCRWR